MGWIHDHTKMLLGKKICWGFFFLLFCIRDSEITDGTESFSALLLVHVCLLLFFPLRIKKAAMPFLLPDFGEEPCYRENSRSWLHTICLLFLWNMGALRGCLSLEAPKADPETRMSANVVIWEVMLGGTECEKVKSGRELSCYQHGQQGSGPQRNWETVQMMPMKYFNWEMKCLGYLSTNSSITGWGLLGRQ